MPWRPLPRIAFAVAVYPFQPSSPADLPLELGDELYIIEQGGVDGSWYRGYLVAPPSLLAGLTSVKGQTLEARVFSGIFPRNCVEVREVLGETGFENGGAASEDDGEEPDEQSDGSRLDLPLYGVPNGTSPDPAAASNGTLSPDGRGKARRSSAGKGRKADKQRPLSGKKAGGARERTLRKGISHPSVRSQKSQWSAISQTDSTMPSTPRDPDAPKPPAPVPMLKVGDETPTSAEEPLVDEIASCLREWHSTNLHDLFLARRYPLLDKISSIVRELDYARRQLLHDVLTNHELERLREKVVWDLVNANKLLGGGVVVRDPAHRGRIMTGEDSAVEITRLQSMMSLLNERPVQPQEASMLHHLLISVRGVEGFSNEPTTLLFYLGSKTPGEALVPVSETYSAHLPLTASGKPGHLDGLRTLFTDLTASDVGDKPNGSAELCIVVKVQSSQLVQAGTSNGTNGDLPSRDGLSTSRSMSNASSFGSMKGGRRSVMWSQKSIGSSFRSKTMQSSAHSLSSQAGQNPQVDDTISPLNNDTNRPESQSSARSQRAVRAKRTVGAGVLRIRQLMGKESETEQAIQIVTAPRRSSAEQRNEEAWDDVINELLGSQSGQYAASSRFERIKVQFLPFVSADADSLIKKTPTLLQDVSQTRRIGFSGAPTKPRSDIYVTINQAFLPKQALLSHPRTGSTPLGHSMKLAHLQVTLEVCRASGEKVQNCIFASSNDVGVTTWQSSVVERDEPWNHVLRLAIPEHLVPQGHITMTLADSPGPPFAISWMPLWDQQAFMRDGHHSTLLYKLDELTAAPSLTSSERGGYLSLPWNSRGKDDVSKDEAVTGPVATLRVQSYLCSTVFSQDQALLGLLKWRERAPEDVLDILQRVVFVPEIEIVKLLSEVFDALFAILVEQAGNDDYEDLVFIALVTVLGIVHDRRFNLGPLVDQYAKSHFNYPFAAPCLIRSFTRLLSNPADSESSRKLRATFKVGRHIFKFIVNAREQQKAKEAGIGITNTAPNFARDLQSIFKGLESLMMRSAPILVGSQTLAVQHFHTWLPELKGFLTEDEISEVAIDFMDCCADVKGKLILYKLILIMNLSRLEIFSQPEQRRLLRVNTVQWLAPYWGRPDQVTDQWRDQVRLCCSVLSTQIDELEQEVSAYLPKIVESYRILQRDEKREKDSLSLLFPTTYPFLTKPITGRPIFNEAMIELSALLAAISHLPGGIHVEMEQEELADFLLNNLQVYLSILECEAFPSNWISILIYHHQSAMKTLEYLARILLDSFLPEPDDAESFNTELWHAFLTALLKLVGSDNLALETFPEQRRRAVWKIAGDVREQGAELLRRTWAAIGWETSTEDRRRWGLERMGGYQVQYVPGLVTPIVELCLSVHGGLRSVAVEVLHTMIVSEWTLSQDLSTVQAEMIECLDRLFKSKHLTESILQKLFINEMIGLFEPLSRQPDDPFYVAARNLLGTIDQFLDMLVAVHSTDVAGEVSHIIHTLRLMEFLRDMQKEDISIRYVHQLAQIQVQSRNSAEAGLALRLHAESYEWDPTRVVAAMVDPDFPEQTAFERKESLYFAMVKHFEDGKSWENALAAYKELADQYESNVFDYAKLARTQRAMAKVHEAVVRGDRQPPRYFRVVYTGLGFPANLRDKQFIYEGAPSERLSAFTDRMQQQHPSAQIVTGGEIEDVEGQFLQISPVGPHRDLFHPLYRRSRVLQPIRDYLLSTWPSHFAVTTRRSPTGLGVKDQWVEKVVYTTVEAFPTILRRSEIVATDEVRLSAVQTAIERTHRKTQELATLERRIVENNEGSLSTLTESLAYAVDPLSETGVTRYRELLPELEEAEEGEEEAKEVSVAESGPLEEALQAALVDHAMAVKRCLGTYSKTTDPQFKAAQEELTHRFEMTYAPEIASIMPTATSPSPAQPLPAAATASLSPKLAQEKQMAMQQRAPAKAEAVESLGPLPESRTTRSNEKNRLSLGFLRQSSNEIADLLNGIGSDNGGDNRPSSRRSRSKSIKRRSQVSDGVEERNTLRSRGSGAAAAPSVTASISAGNAPPPPLDRSRSGGGGDGEGERPQTSASSVYTLSSSVGSVRKRLSLLKMGGGKKKTSVKVGMVLEE
ncbi:MAG: hypothetical protein M1832_001699 [Thelocarpon impressellum]|nr:MAG: hypothetical protein M1832_001699 [Thelocarpon impressellum]